MLKKQRKSMGKEKIMEKGLKLNVLNVAKRVILHLIVPQMIKRSYKELGVNSNLIKQVK